MNEILLFIFAAVCIGALGYAFIRITDGTPFANHAP